MSGGSGKAHSHLRPSAGTQHLVLQLTHAEPSDQGVWGTEALRSEEGKDIFNKWQSECSAQHLGSLISIKRKKNDGRNDANLGQIDTEYTSQTRPRYSNSTSDGRSK